jgi:carboxypeptidase Q
MSVRRLMQAAVVAMPLFAAAPLAAQFPGAQPRPIIDPVLKRLFTLGMDSSQVVPLSQALLDSVGPRLNGSPGHKAGNDWLVKQYAALGITAKNEQYGTWRSWRRGISHVDLITPRVRSLEATMLAWSPGTNGKPVQGPVVVLPMAADSMAFNAMLPSLKGKFVLASAPQPTCRPDDNWQRWAEPASFDRIKAQRDSITKDFDNRLKGAGVRGGALHKKLEQAGALGVMTSLWSQGWGVTKIFSTTAEKAPVFDVSCEDFGLLWRLAERNQGPVIRVTADAQFLGEQPVFNTIAELKGEKADEFVMLSAHFDSWDGGSGATDNGTGTITMMEALRLLSLAYGKPKRTILVGHWGGEEQGLNGSHAYVEDHPEVLKGLQALFNQDNGTGRIANVSTSGFLGAVPNYTQWLAQLPSQLTQGLSISLPGSPAGGGSDHASFVCAGAPGFSLGATAWNYGDYTWHTGRDTWDKIVFDDLKKNATMTAMLAYLAAEDPDFTSRDKMPGLNFPACQKAARTSVGSAR